MKTTGPSNLILIRPPHGLQISTAYFNIELKTTCDFSPQPYANRNTALTLVPHGISVRFARPRTEETFEVGIARRRIRCDLSMVCRFCCPGRHPRNNPEPVEVRGRGLRRMIHIFARNCRNHPPFSNFATRRVHWTNQHSPEASLSWMIPRPSRRRPQLKPPPLKRSRRPSLGASLSGGKIVCQYCHLAVGPGHSARCSFRVPGTSRDTVDTCPYCLQNIPAHYQIPCPQKPAPAERNIYEERTWMKPYPVLSSSALLWTLLR